MLFHLLFPFALSVSAQLNGLTVSTQQGLVFGTFSSPNVRQFLGIPYATAGRWQAPCLPPQRKEVFKATSFGDSCVQELSPANTNTEILVLANNLGLGTTESEDCLTINIWSPSVQRKQKTAVLFWIYGGSTVIGTVSYLYIFGVMRLLIVNFFHRATAQYTSGTTLFVIMMTSPLSRSTIA